MSYDDELLDKIKEWFNDSSIRYSEWARYAKRWLDIYNGNQWTKEERNYIESEVRAALTFNRVAPIIDAVVGMEVNNRQDVRYLPKEISDSLVTDAMTDLAEHFRNRSEAVSEESEAFKSTLITGMGWTETYLDMEKSLGDFVTVWRDPFCMLVDGCSTMKNCSDARYIMHIHEVDREDIELLTGQKDFGSADWAQLEAYSHTTAYRDRFARYTSEVSPKEYPSKKVKVVHCQWYDKEEVYTVFDQNTFQHKDLSIEEYNKLSEDEITILNPQKRVKRVYKQAIVGDKVFLTRNLPCNGFTFQCITGKYDTEGGYFYGIVRALEDPQHWSNKSMSVMVDTIGRQAKGGLFAEDGVFRDVAKAEAEYSRPGNITIVEQGALSGNRLRDKTPGAFPADLQALMTIAGQALQLTTGLNLEFLGLADRQQSPGLESQRRQSAATVLAPMFDNLRIYRKEAGKVLMELILAILPPGKVARILGPGSEQVVQALFSGFDVDFDVVVDQSPYSPNIKQDVWSSIIQLLSQGLPVPPEVIAELLPYSPLPAGISQKVAAMLTQKQQPSEEDQQASKLTQQLQLAGMEATAADKQASAQLKSARARDIDLKNKSVEADIMSTVIRGQNGQ